MSLDTTSNTVATKNIIARMLDSDLWHSFKSSPVTIVSAIVTVILIGAAVFAPILAPHNPFDLATIDIM
ncbi:MAG: ABC transporter permease, partial [Alphaproteobacteria bacterium]|nr:ABC transporter permease [Alphaproteobacteria bacterium]